MIRPHPVRTLAVAALFGIGYPVALVVLARGRVVLAERRWRWFLAHQLAMAAITAGWLVLGQPLGALPNAAWLLIATVLWLRR